MESRRLPLQLILLIALGLLALGGLLRLNLALAAQGWGSRAFWAQYASLRVLIMEKASPYGAAAMAEAQTLAAGRFPLPAGLPGTGLLRYTWPLYGGLLVLPFALLKDAILAQALWMTAQQAALAAVLLLGVALSGWRPAWPVFGLMAALLGLSAVSLLALTEGGMAVWTALFGLLTLLAMRDRRYEAAGVLLLFSFTEPSLNLLWTLFVLVWAGRRRIWALPVWFFGMMVLVSAAWLLLDASWPLAYLRLLWRFSEHIAWVNPGRIFGLWWPALGGYLGWGLSGLVGLLLLLEWRLALLKPERPSLLEGGWGGQADWRRFLWVGCLTLGLTPLSGLPTAPSQAVLLLFPLILVFGVLEERWRRGGRWAALGLGLLAFGWTWGLFWRAWQEGPGTARLSLIFPLPLLLLVALYWVRWRAVRPPLTGRVEVG